MNKSLMLIMTGIAIGLLVAPDKGSKTREKISDKLDDIKDRSNDAINKLFRQGREVVRRAEGYDEGVSNVL